MLSRVLLVLALTALLADVALGQPADWFSTVREGSVEDLRVALVAGANVHARDEGGRTPLVYAASNANLSVLLLPLGAGTVIEAHDHLGWTPLVTAILFSENPDAVRVLLDAGANLEAGDVFGSTPLMHAASDDDPDAVRLLLAAGAGLGVRDATGMTPLMHAASGGFPDVVQVLLDAGLHSKPVTSPVRRH